MAWILTVRYFPDCSILEGVLKRKSLYVWKSLLFGMEIIGKGIRYVLGDGSLVKMWNDPWIPDHPPRPREPNITPVRVNEFYNHDRSDCNIQKLKEEVIEEDINKILEL